MKVLFIGNTRLGDAILSTPILNFYNKKNNEITVICSSLSEKYLLWLFLCKKSYNSEKKEKRHALARSLYNVREKKWDLVIDLRNSLLSRLIRKHKIIRYNESSDKIHKVESYCKLIGLKKSISPFIPKNNTNQKIINNLIKKNNIKLPILVVAPITNWKRKIGL